MKANQTKSANAVLQLKSVKDAAYQFARTGETSQTIAKFIMEQDPTFPSELSKELKADLSAGFMLRAHELGGIDEYRLGDTGVFIKLGNTTDPKYQRDTELKGIVQFNVILAMSMSQQEFGQLKNKNPQEHAIMKDWRDRFSKYVFNNIAQLKSAARLLINADKPRERTANKNFTEALNDAFDTFDKRAKNAEARGDETASSVKFRMARDAFFKTYNA